MSFAIIFLSQRNNTLTLGRTNGRWKQPPSPFRFFWNFSKRIKLQHLTFSVDVCLFLAGILIQVQWWSVSMVTRYDIISSRWSSHFEWECMSLFQLFSTIKEKSCAYLCVIIHVKQLPFLAVLTWFLILGKIKMAAKMATIVGDVTGLQQCHHS